MALALVVLAGGMGDVVALLVAILIVALVAYAVTLLPLPEFMKSILWVIVAIIIICLLYTTFFGGGLWVR